MPLKAMTAGEMEYPLSLAVGLENDVIGLQGSC